MFSKKVRRRMLSFFILISFVLGLGLLSIEGRAQSKLIKVHYIDVGQADSILVQSGGSNMLIDAGNREDEGSITKYLEKQGVKKLDFVIGTHPHEDHIGGMSGVLKAFSVGKIIMPKVTSTTKTFRDLLLTIKGKGMKVTTPIVGNSFKLGEAVCTIMAPSGNSYEDINNYSVVIRMVYGSNAFMFEGDAEGVSEKEMLSKGLNVKADVLKLGHHGSNSSSTEAFLDAVKPKYGIISCGKNNDYGHPHKETLDKLNARKIKYYRTDINGTIVCSSDGKNISFTTTGVQGFINTKETKEVLSNGNLNKNATGYKEPIVYITKSGTKYHLENCTTLKGNKIPIKLTEAKAKGYLPCKVCKPPE